MFLAANVDVVRVVDPATAKFTPCLKLPALLRYASKKGSLKYSVEIHEKNKRY